MANPLDKVRARNPKYAGFGDKDLARIISAQTGDDFDTVSGKLGLKFNEPPKSIVSKDPDVPTPNEQSQSYYNDERYKWADRDKFNKIREKNPKYKDLSDHGILQLISSQTGDELDTVARKLAKKEYQAKEEGFFSELYSAVKQGGRNVAADIGMAKAAIKGDTATAEKLARRKQEDAFKNTPSRLRALNEKFSSIGQDESLDTIGKMGSAAKEFFSDPTGATLLISQQAANMLPTLVPGLGGYMVGAKLAGVAGGAALGTSGLALGNMALSTGEMVSDKLTDQGISQADLDLAKAQGATKGLAITAVDVASLGIGGAIAKAVLKPVQRAAAKAEATVLMNAGVDMSSKATIDAALKGSPELFKQAQQAGAQVFKEGLTKTRKSVIAGTNLGVQTVGEGAGEALGSYAATGKVDPVDVVIESLAGAGMSTAETAFTYSQTATPDVNIKQIQQQAASINDDKLTRGIGAVAAAKSSDEAIAAAKATVDRDPTTPKDIWDSKQAQEDLLRAINSKTVTPQSTSQLQGGISYEQEGQEQETNAQTEPTDVLKRRTERQLENANRQLQKHIASGDDSAYTQSVIKFLTNHVDNLSSQLETGQFVPATKLDQFRALINSTLETKIRSPETWTENDEKLINLAQRQMDLLARQSKATSGADTEILRNKREEIAPILPEKVKVGDESALGVPAPTVPPVVPMTQPELPSAPQQVEGQPVKEVKDEEFADHVLNLYRDQSSGETPLQSISGEDAYAKAVATGQTFGMSPEQYNKKYQDVVLRKNMLPSRLEQMDQNEGIVGANVPSLEDEKSDTLYEKIELRPDTTEAQIALGRNVYKDKVEKMAAREGGKVLALNIEKDFREGKGTLLVDKEVKSTEDLADLAQILRDPRFETLRVFFVKNNRIVEHYGLTSRLPGSVIVSDQRRLVDTINAYMKLNAADGYYLLHNHPSGKAAPSDGDLRFTRVVSEYSPGFKGHVVIDSNEYATIDAEGKTQVTPAQFKEIKDDNVLIPHDALNLKILKSKDLADLGKTIQAPKGFFSVVGLDSSGQVRAITEMPDSMLDQPKLKLANKLRVMARHTGSRGAIAVIPEGSEVISHPVLQDAVKKGVLYDVLGYYKGKLTAFSDFAELFPNRKFDTFAYKKKVSSGPVKTVKVDQSIPPFLRQNMTTPAPGTKQEARLTKLEKTPVDQAERIAQVAPPERDIIRDRPLPEETLAQKIQRINQDEVIRVKVLQDFIEKELGTKLSEAADVYTRENLSKAQTANKIENFRKAEVEPLIKDLAKNKIAIWEIAEYLEMRHVPEANEVMRVRHKDPEAMANGIPDEEANRIVAEYEARPDAKVFKALAGRLWRIGEDTLNQRLDAGLISQEQYEKYNETYKMWVPLRGNKPNYGVKDKRRFGHQARDEYVFENLVLGREIAIGQVERNKLAMSVVQFLLEADRPDIGTVGAPTKMMALADRSYVVSTKGVEVASFSTKKEANDYIAKQRNSKDFSITETDDPQVVMRTRPFLQDNEMEVYVNGNRVRIQINDPLAQRALIGMGEQAVGALVEVARSINRYLSKSYTAWSPDFILTNIVRDLGGGTMILAGEKGGTFAAKVLAKYPTAIKELIRDQRNPGSSKAVNDYRESGGNTGAAWSSDIDRLGQDSVMAFLEHMNFLDAVRNQREYFLEKGYSKKAAITAAISKVGYAKILRAPLLGHFLRVMEALNGVAENAMRLATYQTAVKEGLTNQEAGAMAKNLMNFNRHGEMARQWGALYMFFNPGMQGVHVFGKAFLTSEHRGQVWAMGAGMATVSFMLAEMMRGGDDEDEQKWKNTPKHVKERNLIVGTTGGTQITVPVPYGFGIFHSFGNMISDVIHGEDISDLSWDFASALFSHFVIYGNPFVDSQGNKEIRPELMLPTLAKMAVAPATNVDGLGRPVTPFKYDQSIPDSSTMTRSVRNTWYEGMASSLNEITGGDKFTPGAIDISPNTLKYWVTSVTGGWGRALTDTTQGAAGLMGGVAPEVGNIPIVRKFVRQPDVGDARSGFYAEANKIKAAAKRFSKAAKENDITAMDKMLDERSDIKELSKIVDGSIKQAGFLRDMVIEVQADKSLSAKEKKLKVRELEKEEESIYLEFFKIVKEQ